MVKILFIYNKLFKRRTLSKSIPLSLIISIETINEYCKYTTQKYLVEYGTEWQKWLWFSTFNELLLRFYMHICHLLFIILKRGCIWAWLRLVPDIWINAYRHIDLFLFRLFDRIRSLFKIRQHKKML